LREKRIGGDVFVFEIEAVQQWDGHADLVGLFYGLDISLAGEGADFFWV
jgi:hypothetical protein